MVHLMEKGEDQQLISVLSAGLVEEGWRSDLSLPPGWRCRMTLQKKYFLNEKFELFTSNLKALEFASEHYDQKIVERFKKLIENFSKRKSTTEASENSATVCSDSISEEDQQQETLQESSEEVSSSMETQSVEVQHSRRRSHSMSWSAHPELPTGWQRKGSESSRLLMSPAGTVFKSPRLALKHLVANGGSPEDWTEDESLPTGWLIQRAPEGTSLTANDGLLFNSVTEATEFVNKYSLYFDSEDIGKIQKLAETSKAPDQATRPKARKGGDEYWTSDPALPHGWRKQKGKGIGIKNPAGDSFKSPRLALKHTISNNGSDEEVSTLREYLLTQGWKEGFEKLPTLWFYKTAKIGRTICFLTESGDLLQNKVAAISYLRQHSSNPDENIQKMKSFNFDDVELCAGEYSPLRRKAVAKKEETKRTRKDKLSQKSKRSSRLKKSSKAESECWTEDETVPKGWRQKILTTFGDSRKVQILISPSGQTFRGKREALRHLIEKGHPEDMIVEMRNLLAKDGWISDQKLPVNWLFKTQNSHTSYCSPTGRYFKTRDQAVKFARASNESEEVVRGLLSFCASEREVSWEAGGESLPPGWRQRTLQLGRERCYQELLSPWGQTYRGKRAALTDMVHKDFPHQQIHQMRDLLQSDGWNYDSRLPEDWLVKSGKSHSYFCNPAGQYFKTKAKAVLFLRDNGTDRELELLTNFSLSRNESKQGDETASDAMESSDTSVATDMEDYSDDKDDTNS